jgi:glycosyltransferase involved in cell wall biosynthesis
MRGRATAAVSLSLKEAGGTSLQEAMAAGVPVVATAWGGHMTRMIPEAGALIALDGRESVIGQTAAALKRLIADAEHRRFCGAAAREHARHTFRWTGCSSAFRDAV